MAVDDNENEKRRLFHEHWRVALSLSAAATEAQEKQKEQAFQLAVRGDNEEIEFL